MAFGIAYKGEKKLLASREVNGLLQKRTEIRDKRSQTRSKLFLGTHYKKFSSHISWPTTDRNCRVNGFILLVIKPSKRNYFNDLSKPQGNLYQMLQIRLTSDSKLRITELFVDLAQSQTYFQPSNTDYFASTKSVCEKERAKKWDTETLGLKKEPKHFPS